MELPDKDNTVSDVWVDAAYRSKKNEGYMEKTGFVVHRKKPRPMPAQTLKSNGRKSKVRPKVEQAQKHRD